MLPFLPLCVVLSFSPSALANTSLGAGRNFVAESSKGGGYKFEASPLMKADLAVWIISAILFFIEAILCLIVLIRVRGRRFTYTIFLISQVLLSLRSVSGVVYIFVENNARALEAPVDTLVFSEFIVNLANRLGRAFLFIGIVYLILDRHEAIDRAAGGRIGHIDSRMPLVHYSLFLGTVALAVVSSIFEAQFDRSEWGGFYVLHPKEDQARDYERVQNVTYAYQGFWGGAGLYVLFFIAITYFAMKRMNVDDKVMKLVLYALAPLQACETIFSVAFTILLSPAGPKYAQTTTGDLQYSLADTFLVNACLVGMCAAALLPGLFPTKWRWNIKEDMADQGMPLRPISVLSAPPAYEKGAYVFNYHEMISGVHAP